MLTFGIRHSDFLMRYIDHLGKREEILQKILKEVKNCLRCFPVWIYVFIEVRP